MDIRKKQILLLLFWRRYSTSFDQINRKSCNNKFATEKKNAQIFTDQLNQGHYIYLEILRDLPIDYFEIGVFIGNSIREWINPIISLHSRFYGFEIFTGLPEHGFKDFSKIALNVGGKILDIFDYRVTFVKGIFRDTLENFLNGLNGRNRIVVHLDADLYSSLLFFLLSMLYCPKEGDLILVDDFQDPLGEFMAFSNYCQAYMTTLKLIPSIKFGELFDKVAFMAVQPESKCSSSKFLHLKNADFNVYGERFFGFTSKAV